jgi:hypothetical protein
MKKSVRIVVQKWLSEEVALESYFMAAVTIQNVTVLLI